MPFLLPALPALIGGVASAGASALGNSIFGGGQKGRDFQAQGASQQDYSNALGQTQSGIGQQQQFLNALAAQGGIGNQSSVFGQQQGLANMLGMQSMGMGPNPALAQLANTTGQNINNQAALMAGQRGVGMNPGMAARNIGQMGAQQQQNAVGQAAAMSAQQQLAAQQALQNQQAMMANLATQQVGQQQGALGQLGMMNQNYQNQLGSMLGGQNQANANMAGINTQAGNKQIEGTVGGIGSALQNAFMPKKGIIQGDRPGFAEGGMVSGPKSKLGQQFMGMKGGGYVPGKAKVAGDSPQNDTVPAMLSPGEIVIPRSKVNDPDKAKAFVEAILAKKGLS